MNGEGSPGMNENTKRVDRRTAFKHVGSVAVAAIAATNLGCSRFLLGTGKILFGDPTNQAEFTTLTRTDLTKGDKTLLVICSTPESVESETSNLKVDLIDGVTRRLKIHGVKIINPDKVAEWLDDHGGYRINIDKLAHDFETDYIAHINVQTFSLREPNSVKLLRGTTTGVIHVFKIEDFGGQRQALSVYTREFSMNYPEHQPISETNRSAINFNKEYMAKLSEILAERFYNHRPGVRM
jgi:hypothetical protein